MRFGTPQYQIIRNSLYFLTITGEKITYNRIYDNFVAYSKSKNKCLWFWKDDYKKMSSGFERLWNSLQLDHVIHSNY